MNQYMVIYYDHSNTIRSFCLSYLRLYVVVNDLNKENIFKYCDASNIGKHYIFN